MFLVNACCFQDQLASSLRSATFWACRDHRYISSPRPRCIWGLEFRCVIGFCCKRSCSVLLGRRLLAVLYGGRPCAGKGKDCWRRWERGGRSLYLVYYTLYRAGGSLFQRLRVSCSSDNLLLPCFFRFRVTPRHGVGGDTAPTKQVFQSGLSG